MLQNVKKICGIISINGIVLYLWGIEDKEKERENHFYQAML